MGGAYAKGYVASLIAYAKSIGVDLRSMIDFEADFAPFQPTKQQAIEGVPTFQFSHSEDHVAGNKQMPGAKQIDTSEDEEQGHSIQDFIPQINNLPEGKYKI